MTDPLIPADDGGLNSSDALDWADQKTATGARLAALVIFPAIFVALCVIGGLMFWQRSLNVSPTKTPVAAVAPAVQPSPAVAADKDAEIARLRNQLLALENPGAAPATTPTPVYSPDPNALAQLSARLDRIEANQHALAHAAAAANAAEALQAAARTSRPFLSELAVVEPALGDPGLTAPLRPYAEHGVPSEVALAVDFPAVAARANIAAKADGSDKGLWAKLQHALGSFISIRRTDRDDGQDVDTLLHRAESRLNIGDLHGAVANLNALPTSAQTAIKPWLDMARARLLVDDTTQHVSEVALTRLSQSSDQPAPAAGGVL